MHGQVADPGRRSNGMSLVAFVIKLCRKPIGLRDDRWPAPARGHPLHAGVRRVQVPGNVVSAAYCSKIVIMDRFHQ